MVNDEMNPVPMMMMMMMMMKKATMANIQWINSK